METMNIKFSPVLNHLGERIKMILERNKRDVSHSCDIFISSTSHEYVGHGNSFLETCLHSAYFGTILKDNKHTSKTNNRKRKPACNI